MEHYLYQRDDKQSIFVIEKQLNPLKEALMMRNEILHLLSRTWVRTIHHDTIDEIMELLDGICLIEITTFNQFLEKRELS